MFVSPALFDLMALLACDYDCHDFDYSIFHFSLCLTCLRNNFSLKLTCKLETALKIKSPVLMHCACALLNPFDLYILKEWNCKVSRESHLLLVWLLWLTLSLSLSATGSFDWSANKDTTTASSATSDLLARSLDKESTVCLRPFTTVAIPMEIVQKFASIFGKWASAMNNRSLNESLTLRYSRYVVDKWVTSPLAWWVEVSNAASSSLTPSVRSSSSTRCSIAQPGGLTWIERKIQSQLDPPEAAPAASACKWALSEGELAIRLRLRGEESLSGKRNV